MEGIDDSAPLIVTLTTTRTRSTAANTINASSSIRFGTVAENYLANPGLVPKGPGEKLKFRKSLAADFEKMSESSPSLRSILMNIDHLECFQYNVLCRWCGGELSFAIKGHGAGAHSDWECGHCENHFDSKFKPISPDFNISYPNFASTFMALRNDTGYAGLSRLLGGLHLKPTSEQTFYVWAKIVYDVQGQFYDMMMKVSLEWLKQYYMDKLGAVPDENGLLPMMVSIDATYPKRGYNAMAATAYVVETFTGIPLTCAVLVKCAKCHWSGNTKQNLCPDNSSDFHGASNDMEGPLAKTMFDWSLLKKVKFETVICDGDSKCFSHIKDHYGKDSVRKELCAGHVGKLLEGHLRDLRNTVYVMVKIKSGKNKGKNRKSWTYKTKDGLTEARLNKAGSYYQRIVKDTSLDEDAKRKHIMGIYKHHSDFPFNSDPNTHNDCYGNCKWKLAKDNDDVVPLRNRGIFSHYLNKPNALEGIRQKFVFLSSHEILSKCTLGLTQNINESLHAKDHGMCSKDVFHGQKRMLFVCRQNCLQHIFGHTKGCVLNYLPDVGTSHILLDVLDKEDAKSVDVAKRLPGRARSSKCGRRLARQQRGAEYVAGMFP